ncbi:putative transmembrane protein [Trifolium repens]|nr:putative transmembrane protein [Trifolium repens]
MSCNKLISFTFQKLSKRRFHGTAQKNSKYWRGLVEKELQNGNIEEKNESLCIYKVPPNMLNVEPKAYIPNNISIGPYHYGSQHLQEMEILKNKFFHRLFDPKGANGTKLEEACKFLEKEEINARSCYKGEIKLSSDEFLKMMLVDGSFIVQLLRDLSENNFKHVPSLSRWMLPTIRRELIMLENQLPMFVLTKLFELTDKTNNPQPQMSFYNLAFKFFYQLLQSESRKTPECQTVYKFKIEHVLDLLRYNIRPKLIGEEPRGSQSQMIHSITELKEGGVKIKACEDRELLDISFGKKWGIMVKELRMPPVYIGDHKGTVFRNMVAFEKCHKRCNPDMTTYMFFLNRLINSAEDVSVLHYKGIIHHSLGNDEHVAELINNIAKEIVPDMNESYLYKVVNEANEYLSCWRARFRASLVHNYLTSWAVGLSTLGALLVLYFTFIQAICGFAEAYAKLENAKLSTVIRGLLIVPFQYPPHSAVFHNNSKKPDHGSN